MAKIENFEAHLFICTNRKAQGDCCANKGAEQLRNELKERVSKSYPEWRGKVRVNASGCLGRCGEGIAAVCYPQAEWKVNLTSASVDELEEMLKHLMTR